ncbi:restriction endonuclease [Peribacillus asahii]|uniref:restriction endonuclease n=1 Tax=Peribacillus asahii TaxID=228899 RepID=UPI00207ADD51|nr:restriction endonuclease [Peribacillus asahii]USK71246.1 restriction endonuclease [Peribacillus asahii]
MWNFFKKKSKPTQPSNLSVEELRKAEMKNARARFTGFAFTEEYGNVGLSEFLFLDEKNKQIGIYKKEKQSIVGKNIHTQPEVFFTIPFEKIGEVSVTNHEGNEMIALWNLEGPIGWNEYKIDELLVKFDGLINEGVFSQLLLNIQEKKDVVSNDYISITFYDANNPGSDEERSIKKVKRWFRILSINVLMEHERLKVEKKNKEKEEFLESHELETSSNQSFYLTDIFQDYEIIVQELCQGPFSSENFGSLKIEAFREGVLFLRDSEGEYEATDYNQRWLNHVFRKWGLKEVKVLSPNDRADKIFLINNPTLQEQLHQELLHFSSIYNMEGKVGNAKIFKVKAKKIYIACEEQDDQELNIWWDDVVSNNDWIPTFFLALAGREFELIFDTELNLLSPVTLDDYEGVWEQVTTDRYFKSSKVQSFKDNTFFIYFTDRWYQETNRLRIYSEQKEVVKQLRVLTGLELKIEIVNPPLEKAENVIPSEVLDWVKNLEQTKEKISMFLPDDEFYRVLVDDKLYFQLEKHELNQEPFFQHLMKRDFRMFESYNGNKMEVYIRDSPINLDKEGLSRLIGYRDSLHQWQMEEIMRIQVQMDGQDKVKELLHHFYEKEIKNRFDIHYLDYLLTEDLELDQDIQKFSRLLLKKEYVKGKDYLITEVVRKKVVKECIQDVAVSFQRGSEDLFENPTEMSYEDTLRAYYQRLFSNIDNDEDVTAFTMFLLYYDKKEMKEGFRETVAEVKSDLRNVNEEDILDDYEAYLFSKSDTNEWDISMVDGMDGHEFEYFLSELFTKLGYYTEVTKGSGDYGIDLIASKKHVKIGIQAKCYSDKVPNKAVQEVIAGLSYYGLDQGMVVTNNYFTQAAKNQAQKANIILWDRDSLMEQMRVVL